MLTTTWHQRSADLLDAAYRLLDQGFSFLPTNADKTPAIREWKHLTMRTPLTAEIPDWFDEAILRQSPRNIAIVAGSISRVVCLDADSPDVGLELRKHLPQTDMMSRTPRGGMHFWYQIEDGQIVPPRVRIAGLELDVRGEVSYALEPPSISSAGKAYRQIGNWNLKDVPYLDERWLEAVIGTALPTCPAMRRTRIRNVASYLKKVESIQGQNGSAGLVRAAAICRDNGLSEAEAMAQLVEWNHGPAVTPAWSLDELARAVTRIYAMATER